MIVVAAEAAAGEAAEAVEAAAVAEAAAAAEEAAAAEAAAEAEEVSKRGSSSRSRSSIKISFQRVCIGVGKFVEIAAGVAAAAAARFHSRAYA